MQGGVGTTPQSPGTVPPPTSLFIESCCAGHEDVFLEKKKKKSWLRAVASESVESGKMTLEHVCVFLFQKTRKLIFIKDLWIGIVYIHSL